MDSYVSANYDADMNTQTTSYIAKNVDYTTIYDTNQMSYNLNWLNYQINLGTPTDGKFVDFSQAKLMIPISVWASLPEDAVLPVSWDVNANYKQLLAPKGWHHLVDTLEVQINNVSCVNKSNYSNFYMNEQLKKMTEDELRIIGSQLHFFPDRTDTIDYESGLGEVNNNVINSNEVGTGSGADANFVNPLKAVGINLNEANDGFVKRLSMIDDLRDNKNTMTKYLKLGGEYMRSTFHLSGLESVDAKNVKYNFLVALPLSKVHPFFEKFPSVSTINMSLRFQLNLGSDTKHVVRLKTPAARDADSHAAYSIISESATYGTGRSSVFQLNTFFSQSGAFGSSKIVMSATATAANVQDKEFDLTLTYSIGWRSADKTRTEAFGSFIQVPTYNFTSDYASGILDADNANFKHTYRDFYVDTIPNVLQGQTVRKLLNARITKARTMYILGFLSPYSSATNPVVTTPHYSYNSCLSSAPNTSSCFYVKEFSVRVGEQPIYSQNQLRIHEFYDQSVLPYMGQRTNGNSLKDNVFYSGLVDRKKYSHSHYIVVDLKNVDSQTTDLVDKSISITMTVDGNNKEIQYEFVVLIDYDTTININRLSGAII